MMPKAYTKFELVHYNDDEEISDDDADEKIQMDVDDEDMFSENSLNVRLSMNTIGKLEPCQEDDAPKLLKMVSWAHDYQPRSMQRMGTL